MESFIPGHGHKSPSQKKVEDARPEFGEKPLTILTHSNGDRNPHWTAAENAVVQKAWSDGHDRLATFSRRGSNTVVPGSTHYIQIDQPKAVIEAVSKVVAEVRRNPN